MVVYLRASPSAAYQRINSCQPIRDNESAISYLSEVAERLNKQRIKVQGENMVTKSLIKRLMMLVVLPRAEFRQGWDEALDSTAAIGHRNWNRQMSQRGRSFKLR